MQDYVDLIVIQKRLRDGYYMSVYSFNIDIRNMLYKASTYMKNDERIVQATANIKAKFKEISKSVNSMPIKQYHASGEHTSAFKGLFNTLSKYK